MKKFWNSIKRFFGIATEVAEDVVAVGNLVKAIEQGVEKNRSTLDIICDIRPEVHKLWDEIADNLDPESRAYTVIKEIQYQTKIQLNRVCKNGN